MRDHAVLVPTSRGGVSAIVTQPGAVQRGALVLLQGAGPPARSGVNALWTRVAHELAGIGLVVIRFDFACEGDNPGVGRDVPRARAWRRGIDLGLLREIAPWFLQRAGERALSVAGSCHGARVALEFAATEPVANGTFLLVPYLGDREPNLRDDAAEDEIPPLLDERQWGTGPTLTDGAELLEGFRACLERGPVWTLVGEEEAAPVRPFAAALEGSGRALELEVAPGTAVLHPIANPVQQEIARERLVSRVAKAFAEREDRVASYS
ncbi:MAG TPA: hypothetical protein VFM94_05760 [Solirubrobacterales bacterium]|nr:hypothetical protein [Solirubrobacterales bacterium]